MSWVTLRCTRCGAYVGAPTYRTLAPSWVTCPHCHSPVTVIAPRDPAPLFTWEAFPGLYPPMPVPRAPGPRLTAIGAVLLAGLAILLAVMAGLLGGVGIAATSAGTYTVAGVVLGPGGLALNETALVHVSGEDGFNETVSTEAGGSFQVPGVPAGGVLVNVTAPYFESSLELLFLSGPYSSVSSPSGLQIPMQPGAPSNASVLPLPVYGSMEEFLTGIYSSSGILAIGALVTGGAAVATARRGPPVSLAVGGAAAAGVPLGVLLLDLPQALPDLYYPMLALVVAGSTAIAVGIVHAGWTLPPEADAPG